MHKRVTRPKGIQAQMNADKRRSFVNVVIRIGRSSIEAHPRSSAFICVEKIFLESFA